MKLTVVTGNKGKQIEWKRLLPADIELETIDIDLDEIQSADIIEVVSDKARKAYAVVKRPVVVEDVAAGLDKLEGLPGTFIKFFEQKMGNAALYLLGGDDALATATSAVAYYDGTNIVTAIGVTSGRVVEPRGDNGFGFDRSFIPDGCEKTYGEMTSEEKDAVSHRSKSVAVLLEKLQSRLD